MMEEERDRKAVERKEAMRRKQENYQKIYQGKKTSANEKK
jgi:hypothetical protein